MGSAPNPRMTRIEQARAAGVALLAAVTLGAQIGCSSMKFAAKTSTGSAEGADPATTLYQLPSGMRVLIREDHFAPVAALQVWVGAGGADENDVEAGVAHVHEHMLFKGTSNRGVGEIAAEIESSGGRINAWTSWNETVYHIVVASRYADTGLRCWPMPSATRRSIRKSSTRSSAWCSRSGSAARTPRRGACSTRSSTPRSPHTRIAAR
jgi:hypothetical protein